MFVAEARIRDTFRLVSSAVSLRRHTWTFIYNLSFVAQVLLSVVLPFCGSTRRQVNCADTSLSSLTLVYRLESATPSSYTRSSLSGKYEYLKVPSPTHSYNHQHCIIDRLEFVIWFVPSLIGGALAVSFVGVFLGPIYPLVMNHTAQILPRSLLTGSIGWIAGVGQAGSACIPFITGAIASKAGIASLQPV